MPRAGQTPHGARPNREEVRDFGCGHVPARCVKPSGRSLEPRSNARPRGMAVPPEQSSGQNSAYRSGCHKLLFSITSKANKARCDSGVTHTCSRNDTPSSLVHAIGQIREFRQLLSDKVAVAGKAIGTQTRRTQFTNPSTQFSVTPTLRPIVTEAPLVRALPQLSRHSLLTSLVIVTRTLRK